MKTYKGISVSPGAVQGTVLRLRHDRERFPMGPFDPVREQQRLTEALSRTQKELEQIMERLPEAEKAIVEFQWMLLEDDGMMNEVRYGLREGLCAAEAMDRAGRMYAKRLDGMEDNPYMQLRAVDILDVSSRVVGLLCGRPRGKLEVDQPVILVTDRLMPTDLFRLEPEMLLGAATAFGSAESHAAILARALGIPGVMQLGEEFLQECEGRFALLDAGKGECVLEPECCCKPVETACCVPV